jgi:serine protease Do
MNDQTGNEQTGNEQTGNELDPQTLETIELVKQAGHIPEHQPEGIPVTVQTINNETPPQGLPEVLADIPQTPAPGFVQAGNIPQTQAYTLPQTPQSYVPPKREKTMSNRTLKWICIFFACLAIAIIVLSYLTLGDTPLKNPLNDTENAFEIPQNLPQSPVEITVEQAARPLLSSENYADESTGRFSSVGIAEFVMPSIALVKVYGDDVYTPLGTGSGVIMSSNGYIITNAHVIEGGQMFSVQLSSGKIYEATVVGSDSKQDVGVLKIDAEGLTPAVFGKSSDVKLGEEVAVVASAGQTLADAITFGNVSNVNRTVTISTGASVDCLQIDAAVNPGNSGGPVVNMYGQVIGIVDSKKVGIDGTYNANLYEGIGFALQIDNVIETAESIIEYGYSTTSVRVGILYVAVDDITASYFGVPSGLLVEEIDPSCDIANSGLRKGDIITAIDGKKLLTPESVAEAFKGKKPGDMATIEFVRKDLDETVVTYKSQFAYAPVVPYPSNDTYNADDESAAETLPDPEGR